jgi:hypothetical protein
MIARVLLVQPRPWSKGGFLHSLRIGEAIAARWSDGHGFCGWNRLYDKIKAEPCGWIVKQEVEMDDEVRDAYASKCGAASRLPSAIFRDWNAIAVWDAPGAAKRKEKGPAVNSLIGDK